MKKATRKTDERKSAPAKRQAGQPQQEQQYASSGAGKQYGEGSYSGTRQYNKGLKEHMQSHDIEREARDAAPRSSEEAAQMDKAEQIGRSRAKGSAVKK